MILIINGKHMDTPFTPHFITILVLLSVWALPWKGVALWKAARNGHTAWFIALLLLNTVALLEIVYIFFFSKPKKSEGEVTTTVVKE